YLVHRRDAFRGDAAAVKELESKDNVEFVLNANVTKILGDKKVEGVEVTDKLTGETRVIEVQGLFVAIGQMPENTAFQNLVDLDAGGYIAAGEDCLTKTSGIYTAGDCRTKTVRQLTTAAADGAVAALAAASGIK
ncbi:MAG: FAD-dependent oxidoreductase, partial [Eubacterium sp.]|nr:FAD-dependent oxidoreductase [Eubacterium sp.]